MYTHIYIIYMCNIYIEYVCVYTYRCINPSWSTIPRAVGEPRCPAWKRCAPLPRKRAASKRMAWMGTGFPGFWMFLGGGMWMGQLMWDSPFTYVYHPQVITICFVG